MSDLPTIDLIATGVNITAMRQRAGLSVRDLQDIFGFSTPQAIYKWQRGDAMPTLDTHPAHHKDGKHGNSDAHACRNSCVRS